MLDRLETALRRHELVRQKPGPFPLSKVQELSRWLEEDVCAVVEDLIDRPDFQAEARWPIDHLGGATLTDERSLIKLIDAGLVDFAQQLAGFARLPAIRTPLLRLGEHNELLPEGKSTGSARRNKSAKKTSTPLGLPAIDCIARRPWRDLVTTQDYFYPASDLNLTDRDAFLRPDSSQVQIAEFCPALNPRLQSLGDFVSTILLIRVEYWQHILQRFWVRCQMALQNTAQAGGSPWEKILEARRQLDEHSERLKLCLTGKQAAVRGSCTALLQVYAEYRPLTNLHWLGLPNWTRTGSSIRYRIEGKNGVAIGEQVAAALVNVTEIYRKNVDPEALVEAKCRLFPLVLVTGQGRREVYWQGCCLEVDWFTSNAQWDLLTAMVERVKSAQGADEIDLKLAIHGSMKDRRHRLKSCLPANLNEKIESVGRGTYRLALRAEEVCLLRFDNDEQLVEV